MSAPTSSAEVFGHDVLGPVFHKYLHRLHGYMAGLDDGNTAYLFAARAGIRIKELYDAYIEVRGVEPLPYQHVFWISRVLACKALLRRQTDLVVPILERNYYGMTVDGVCKALLRYRPDVARLLDNDAPLMGEPVAYMAEVARGGVSGFGAFDEYLGECEALFEAYLDTMRPGGPGSVTRFVVIDSGWQGTTQMLLHHSYRADEWFGLYFARILENMFDPAVLARLVGVMFERDTYNPSLPITSIIVHRHLVENLFETPGKSIEELTRTEDGEISSSQAAGNLNAGAAPDDYPLLAGILRYLAAHAPDETPRHIEANYREAVATLNRVLTRPTPNEARILAGGDRSMDFGKAGEVPVLHTPNGQSTRAERIARSLWEPGQIALEYADSTTREQLQLQSLRSGAK